MAIDNNNDITSNKDLQYGSSSSSSCPAFSSSSSSHSAFSGLLEAATKSFIDLDSIEELKKMHKRREEMDDAIDAIIDAIVTAKRKFPADSCGGYKQDVSLVKKDILSQGEFESQLQDKLEKEQREQVKRNIVVETIPNLDEKLDSSEVAGICNGIDVMDGKCKFSKKLVDQIAEEAKKEANKINADPKVLGSYVAPNSVKDCGKYFDLNDEPIAEEDEEKQQQQNNKKNIVEDSREKSILTWRSTWSSVLPKSTTTNSKLMAISSKMSKLTELINKINDLQHAFGDDVLDKVPFILKLMLGESFRKILWQEAEVLKQYGSLHNELHVGLLVAVEMLDPGPCSPESGIDVEWFVLDEVLLKLPMDKLLIAEELMLDINKNPDM